LLSYQPSNTIAVFALYKQKWLLVSNKYRCGKTLALYPGFLTPAFAACSTNTGVRRPGYEASKIQTYCNHK